MHKDLEFWLNSLLAIVLCICGQTANCFAQSPTFLVRKSAIWKYSAGEAQPPADWKDATFDDAAWKSGPAGFGYGRPSGKLFDGDGIEVDIAVMPALADHTSGADTVLQRAIAVVTETAR